jgi:hypothetical protein
VQGLGVKLADDLRLGVKLADDLRLGVKLADDLKLVIMKKSSNVQVSQLPLMNQLHPLSNWQREGSASSSADWRFRIEE